MEIATLHAHEDNFVYAGVANGAAVVIDPGEAAPVRAFLAAQNLRLDRILLTHHHADHVGGVAELVREHAVEVICSHYDLARIATATRGVGDGDTFDVLGTPVRVIATPGHTLGHVAYHLPAIGAVFTGDTLFSGGCGRLFEGTAEQMYASLGRLAALPAETRVYFGHEYTLNNLGFVQSGSFGPDHATVAAYEEVCRVSRARGQATTPSTIANELRINPFLMAKTSGEFGACRRARDSW